MESVNIPDNNKIGRKNWLIIWIAGLAGQLCWNVENQWFNTFVYAKIAPDPSIIAWMVAVSAAVTTLSTFINGTLSDRLGKRRPFMGLGYIMWGASTIIFGLTQFVSKSDLKLVAALVVIADAVMSYLGSFGNDAGFNPWTTDISNERNRGGLGAAVAVQPVVATIVGSVAFGYIIGLIDYMGFFIFIGASIGAVGIYCLLTVKESPALKPNRDPKGFLHQLFSVIGFRIFRKNRLLIWILLIFAMFFISFNIYFPHMLNYLIYTRGNDVGTAGLLLGAGLILAIPFTILAGKPLNKGRFATVLSISVIANFAGLFLVTINNIFGIILGIWLVGGGYMCVYQALMVWIKNQYPEESRAQFEGIRLLYYVCIPMIIGPAIATQIIKRDGLPIVNDFGISGTAPNNSLFFIAACFVLLTFIPIYFAYREQHKVKV